VRVSINLSLRLTHTHLTQHTHLTLTHAGTNSGGGRSDEKASAAASQAQSQSPEVVGSLFASFATPAARVAAAEPPKAQKHAEQSRNTFATPYTPANARGNGNTGFSTQSITLSTPIEASRPRVAANAPNSAAFPNAVTPVTTPAPVRTR
jgi:hypothetical protein